MINYDQTKEQTEYTIPSAEEILLVDDEPINLMVCREMLRLINLESTSTTSGKQAIAVIKERIDSMNTTVKETAANCASMFKLILLDYSMSDMNGPEVATKIRQMLEANNIE